MTPDGRFWRDKNVLLTGHTGFKGSWLALWLARLGARVIGVALPPPTDPSLFVLARLDQALDSRLGDIRSREPLMALVRDVRPDIVFHLAAQPLVRAGYRQPVETFTTNVVGTLNVLEALRETEPVRVAVMATTDKVYRDLEPPRAYGEDDPLGGDDPYSASKAAAEILIHSYRNAFLARRGIAVASARAGNVIGGGDWSEDRLIPDAMRAWQAGKTLHVRRPQAIRPWQHVLDPLFCYLRLAEMLWEKPDLAGGFNFGPDPQEATSVRKVVELARQAFPQGQVLYQDVSDGPEEAAALSLDVSKARALLGVSRRWTLERAVDLTMRWYREQAEARDARRLCEADILAYENAQ